MDNVWSGLPSLTQVCGFLIAQYLKLGRSHRKSKFLTSPEKITRAAHPLPTPLPSNTRWRSLWKLICYLKSHCSRLHFDLQPLYALPLPGEVQAPMAPAHWVFSPPFSPAHSHLPQPLPQAPSHLASTTPAPALFLCSPGNPTPKSLQQAGWKRKRTTEHTGKKNQDGKDGVPWRSCRDGDGEGWFQGKIWGEKMRPFNRLNGGWGGQISLG